MASKDSAYRYAETLALDHEASRFFLALVDFNQASTHRERATAYEQMRTFSGYRRAHRLDAAHAEYHSAWYVPAIRELLARTDASADPAWIAAQMLPRISTRDAKNALRILLSLELVERDPESGRFRPKEAVVTTGAEPIGHHIVAYHRAMITQAMHAIDAVPSELRDISSVTLSLPRDGLTALKARLREFRKEVIAMEAASGTGDRVAQLNLQLFPLTEGREEITR